MLKSINPRQNLDFVNYSSSRFAPELNSSALLSSGTSSELNEPLQQSSQFRNRSSSELNLAPQPIQQNAPGPSGINFNVSFVDNGSYSTYYTPIGNNLLMAAADWAQYLNGTASIELEIRFSTSVPTANGASVTSGYVRNNGAYDVYDQGVAAEIRTGIDPNGTTADGTITIGDSYLRNELWFDANPGSRNDSVPIDKTDAYSVFLHETRILLRIMH